MSKKLRVLLADDSRFFRAIESQFLKKTPVEILEADDCSVALSMVRSEKPDLVYMAFSLPKTEAISVARRSKRILNSVLFLSLLFVIRIGLSR